MTVHSPPFWHYDFFQALVVLARMGLAGDPRASDGLDLVEEQAPRRPLALRRPLVEGAGVEGQQRRGVDWGSGPSELLTLHGLRVLRSAGRFAA